MAEKIKKHKKGIAVVLVIAIAVALVAARAASGARRAREQQASESALETATIERRTLSESVSATGQIASAKNDEIAPAVAGEGAGLDVEEVRVKVGDEVREGDVICLLDSSDIRESLEVAKAALSASRQKADNDLASSARGLAEAQSSRDVELERAQQDADSAWEDYEQSLADLGAAEKAYGDAMAATNEKRAGYEQRLQLLREAEAKAASGDGSTSQGGESYEDDSSSGDGASSQGVEAQSEYQKLQEEVAQWEQDYNAAVNAETSARAAYDQAASAVDGKLDAYNQALRMQEDAERSQNSNVTASAENLENAKLNASTTGQTDEQQVKAYEEQIEACTVRATMDGVITELGVEEGGTYSAGTVLARIENLDEYEVDTEIDEYDIGKIEVGQDVVILTNGTGDEELHGKVKSVAPRATQSDAAAAAGTSSTDAVYAVTISMDEAPEGVRLDMTAKLSIIIESREDVLAVPFDALQGDEEEGYYIEVISNETPSNDGNPSGDAAPHGNAASSKDGTSSGDGAPSDDAAPSGGPPSQGFSSETTRIPVEKGIESDYYVEVSGDGVREGMTVLISDQADDGSDIPGMMERRGPMGGF